jgi:hypothetical protein
MATYDAEVITPPAPIEAVKDTRSAEVMNTPVASKPSASVEQRAGIIRRSVG